MLYYFEKGRRKYIYNTKTQRVKRLEKRKIELKLAKDLAMQCKRIE